MTIKTTWNIHKEGSSWAVPGSAEFSWAGPNRAESIWASRAEPSNSGKSNTHPFIIDELNLVVSTKFIFNFKFIIIFILKIYIIPSHKIEVTPLLEKICPSWVKWNHRDSGLLRAAPNWACSNLVQGRTAYEMTKLELLYITIWTKLFHILSWAESSQVEWQGFNPPF